MSLRLSTRARSVLVLLATLAGLLTAPAFGRATPAAAATPAYVTPASATVAAAHAAPGKYHVGVAVLDRRTGKYYAAGDYRGAFATESVVKVFIATRLLVQGAMHGTTAARAYKMITQSDDAIASSLYGRVGGDSLIDWVKRHYHEPDLGSRPTHAGWWGNTHISALGLVRLYAKLAKDPHVSGWLLNAMHHAHRHGSDGTNQFFGIPSATTGFGVKQGWGCDLHAGCDEADFNSTGFINGDRYAVAILVRGPLSTYGSPISAAVTAIARRLLPAGTFPLPAPTLTSLSYTRTALSGAHRISLYGTNFRAVKAVYFGTTRATGVKVLTTHTLHAVVPAHTNAGAVTVRVRTGSGQSRARAATTFHYLAAPTVGTVSITSGGQRGGAKVTISGTGFTDVTSVLFGSSRATGVEATSSRTLHVTVPAHAGGEVTVVVRTRYGTSTPAARYTYLAAPRISTTSLPAGHTATPYSATVQVADGRAGTWQVTSGALPAGLTLHGATISGTPTVAGTGTFAVTFTDSYGQPATASLTIPVTG